jgi:formyl-CoA transferase
MSITGEPGRPSVRIGPSSIDLVTGAHAAFGILLALRHRDATGEGQAIEVSLFDSAVHLVGNHIADYTGSGRIPSKFGSHFPNMAPYGIFQARDREFCLLVSSDDMWQRLCAEVGRPELATDARFQRNADRLRNRDALHEVLGPIFKARDAAEWVAIALKLSIPVTLVHDLAEVVGHEQTVARHALHDTGIHGVKIPAVPLRLSRTPGTIRRNAPELGEHDGEL